MFKPNSQNINQHQEAWTESLRLPTVRQQELELWGDQQMESILSRWKHFESVESCRRDFQQEMGRVSAISPELWG